MRAQLITLTGNLVVGVATFELGDAAAGKSCMTTIANDVLVAQ
jgi:hypothetical protein